LGLVSNNGKKLRCKRYVLESLGQRGGITTSPVVLVVAVVTVSPVVVVAVVTSSVVDAVVDVTSVVVVEVVALEGLRKKIIISSMREYRN
jgi:hypothetical protein